jgi:signal recognition particle subunit SRP54
MVKIVAEELTELMGGEKQDINLKGDPAVVLIAGLQGSGKTTFTGKLSHLLKKQGRSVMVAACDVYRPAAIDQLTVLAEQVGVDIYKEIENKNPVEIAKNALELAKKQGKKVLIVDTAGRLAVDEEMMQEVAKLKEVLKAF